MKMFLSLFILFLACPTAFADTDGDTKTATAKVNPVLSITDNTGDFTLTFSEFTKDSITNLQSVIYDVKANDMTLSALPDVVTVKIDQLMPNITLQAFIAVTVNIGTSGNAELKPHDIGVFRDVTTSPAILAYKDATTGQQGRVVQSRLPVMWRAKADEDLATGTYNADVTVTVKDI